MVSSQVEGFWIVKVLTNTSEAGEVILSHRLFIIYPHVCRHIHSLRFAFLPTGVKVSDDRHLVIEEHDIVGIDIIVHVSKAVEVADTRFDTPNALFFVQGSWIFLDTLFERLMVFGKAETNDQAFLNDATSIAGEIRMWVLSQYIAKLRLLNEQLAWISFVMGKTERCVVEHKFVLFQEAVVWQWIGCYGKPARIRSVEIFSWYGRGLDLQI